MSEIKSIKSFNEEETNAKQYSEFLENMFANVNEEDRYGEITMATSKKFKTLSTLINVLKKWNTNLDENWSEKRKNNNF